MIIYFNSELVKTIGLNESIVLQQIHSCIESNKKSNEYFESGCYWACKSVDLWKKENFSFWSIKTINRIFEKLVNKGLLKEGCFNELYFDRTKWYTINYKLLEDDMFVSVDIADLDKMTKCEINDNTKKTPDKVSSVKVSEMGNIPETITKIMYDNFNIKLTKKQTTALTAACKSDLELFNSKVDLLKKQTGIENVIGWLISALKENFNQTEYTNKNARKRKNKIVNYKGHDWDYEELEGLEQLYLENSLKDNVNTKPSAEEDPKHEIKQKMKIEIQENFDLIFNDIQLNNILYKCNDDFDTFKRLLEAVKVESEKKPTDKIYNLFYVVD